ncbi:unnamed protein product [Sphenostylis stenocarpa]|uniref:Uncharacterized protein n=1 Tax=Sphenostylis stenocarpa TaxID=92480 RepID=A0AA86VEH1_9FABA|nr:unnamed protein product [Sphenostylis stenocarpa]
MSRALSCTTSMIEEVKNERFTKYYGNRQKTRKEGKRLFEIAISTTIIAIATLERINRNVKS